MRSGSIIIADANGFEQEVSLGGGHLRIGSAPDNDIVIAGPDIAPHHATIVYDNRGRLVVEIGAENLVGQGGMRLTFNLAHVARRRDLAWIGDYIVSYQPAQWDRRTQPIGVADLPAELAAAPEPAPIACQSADETNLLHALLEQGFGCEPAAQAGGAHEARTVGMPLLALSAIVE